MMSIGDGGGPFVVLSFLVVVAPLLNKHIATATTSLSTSRTAISHPNGLILIPVGTEHDDDADSSSSKTRCRRCAAEHELVSCFFHGDESTTTTETLFARPWTNWKTVAFARRLASCLQTSVHRSLIKRKTESKEAETVDRAIFPSGVTLPPRRMNYKEIVASSCLSKSEKISVRSRVLTHEPVGEIGLFFERAAFVRRGTIVHTVLSTTCRRPARSRSSANVRTGEPHLPTSAR